MLTAITGVAGSGKSSLAVHELPRRYPDAIVIDQRPIGTSIRSTPATYTGVMDDIRRLFAEANGVDVGWFSFNSKGTCPVCKGTGQITYDMAFAEPVVVVCEECGAHRYNPTALSYCYRGKNIEDVMTLTIEQAMDFFDDAKIRRKLHVMMDVGLDTLPSASPPAPSAVARYSASNSPPTSAAAVDSISSTSPPPASTPRISSCCSRSCAASSARGTPSSSSSTASNVFVQQEQWELAHIAEARKRL